MGHVGRTSGATGAPGEQAYAKRAGEASRTHLNAVGFSCRLIGADVDAQLYRGDMFVALHADGNANPEVSGASVGYKTAEGRQAADSWKRHYVANGWDRGFKPDNYTAALSGYYGNNRAIAVGNRRAFICEAGFMTNPAERAIIESPEGIERIGRCVAAVAVDFFGTRNCPPTPPPPGIPVYPGLKRLGDGNATHPDEGVRVWQHELNRRVGTGIAEDGIFGEETFHVVVHWQMNHGLVADGIAGPATWHSLLFEP